MAKQKVTVGRVVQCDLSGTTDFYEAVMRIDDHAEAITVIGDGLTECLERTMVIINAFNSKT